MKLTVTLSGASPKSTAAIRERAVAVLSAMEAEFHNLKVRISNANEGDKEKSPKAGKDGQLADAGKAAAGGSKRGKAASG